MVSSKVSCAYVVGLKSSWSAKEVTGDPCVNVGVLGTLSTGVEDNKPFV